MAVSSSGMQKRIKSFYVLEQGNPRDSSRAHVGLSCERAAIDAHGCGLLTSLRSRGE
jgi:hypothetical protein